jgi:hypothetical protein
MRSKGNLIVFVYNVSVPKGNLVVSVYNVNESKGNVPVSVWKQNASGRPDPGQWQDSGVIAGDTKIEESGFSSIFSCSTPVGIWVANGWAGQEK